MHSLVDKDDKYIGQFLKIQNNNYSARVFTKFYNLTISDKAYNIDVSTVKDLINMSKYHLCHDNTVYVNDIKTNNTILRPLNIGYYAVFLSIYKKLYLLTEEEFKSFMKNNNYHEEVTINFILGIENIEEEHLSNVKVVLANTLTNAKEIYKSRYNIDETPKFIGIEEDNYIYIPTDKQVISAKLEHDILID